MSEAIKPLQSLLDAFGARLARVEAQLGVKGAPVPAASAAAPAAAPVELSPQLEAYDEYVAQYLPPFLEVSTKLGDDTRKLGEVTEKAFAAQRAYLLMASQCKKAGGAQPGAPQGPTGLHQGDQRCATTAASSPTTRTW